MKVDCEVTNATIVDPRGRYRGTIGISGADRRAKEVVATSAEKPRACRARYCRESICTKLRLYPKRDKG